MAERRTANHGSLSNDLSNHFTKTHFIMKTKLSP